MSVSLTCCRPSAQENAAPANRSSSRWRSVVESLVQANRQVIESAQSDEIEDPVQKSNHLEGRRTGLDIWKENSFDTAMWLYHLVFGPSVEGPPYQASVADESPDRQDGLVTLRSTPRRRTQNTMASMSREMIVWSARTEPTYVVDRLLLTWTKLSNEQISSSHQAHNRTWSDKLMEQLDNNKEGEDEQDSEVSDTCSTATEKSGLSDSWKERPTEFQRRRARLDSKEAPSPRPHVRFNQPFPAAVKNSGIRNKMSLKPTVSTGTTPTVYTIESDDATTIAQHGRRPRRSPPASHGGTTGDSTSNAIDSGKDISKISIGEPPPMYSEVSSKDTKEILKDKGLRKDVSKSQHKRVVPRGNSTPGTLLNDGRYDHPLYQPKPPDTAAPLQYSSPRRNPFLYPRTNEAIDHTPPVHPPEAQWNPFVNSYMNGSAAAWSSVPPPPPATSVPNPIPPPMPVSDNPRLSRLRIFSQTIKAI